MTHRGEKIANRLIRLAPNEGIFNARYYGTRMELDLRDNVQRTIFYKGAYERSLVRFLLAELRPTDTFLDCGAHVGVFALPVARRLRHGRVLAFEPANDTADILEHNAQQSRIRSLTVIRAALGETNGIGSLRSSLDWAADDLGVRSLHGQGPEITKVRIIRFDDWALDTGLNRVDIIKIDVEGHELSVLKGMQGSLARYQPRLIILEIVNTLLKRAGASPKELTDLMDSRGYEPVGPGIDEIAARRAGPFWPNVVLRLAS